MSNPDQIALDFLGQWQVAINCRQPERMAELFAKDAIFVATAPVPLIGSKEIVEYYRATPVGLEVSASLKVARSASPEESRAVCDVVFHLPGGNCLRGRLTLAFIVEDTNLWKVALYHAALQSVPNPD